MSDQKFLNLVAFCGFVAFFCVTILHFLTNWEWSLLMDDFTYVWAIADRPTWGISDFAIEQIRIFWSKGRVLPVYSFLIPTVWKTLPLYPLVFHTFLFVVFGSIIFATASSVRNILKSQSWFVVFGVSLAFLITQRPLLDILTLITIPETWVLLFLVLGIWAFSKNIFLARSFFLLSMLSKEPGVAAFFALSVTELHRAFTSDRKSYWIKNSVFDFLLFLIFAFTINRICLYGAGSYLGEYNFLSARTAHNFVINLAKVLMPLFPIFLLGFFVKKAALLQATRGIIRQPAMGWILFSLTYGLVYLFFVSPRNTSGYLLIPAAYCFSLFGILVALSLLSKLEISKIRIRLVFCICFLLVLSLNLFRSEIYKNGIMEVTTMTKSYFSSSTPHLLIFQGAEQADTAALLAKRMGNRSKVIYLDDKSQKIISEFKGNTLAILNTDYFDTDSKALRSQIEAKTGPWQRLIKKPSYEIFRVPSLSTKTDNRSGP